MVIEIITVVVALYGAILSTYIYITQRNDKRRKIKVKLTAGLMNPPTPSQEFMLFLEVINIGNRKVTINSTGLRLPEGQTVISLVGNTHVTLPFELEEGKNCHFWFEIKDLAGSLSNSGKSGKIKLKGYANDGADNTFYSKPYEFDIDDWLNS